jgi:hypothetical protein
MIESANQCVNPEGGVGGRAPGLLRNPKTTAILSGPYISGGYNVPVHHTEASARVRIFVEQGSSAELEKISREFRKKLAAAKTEMSAKGKILSGAMTGEIARITGEMITGLVTKRLELWLETCDGFGVTITDEVASEIRDDVLALRSVQIQNAAKVGAQLGGQPLPGGSGDMAEVWVLSAPLVTPAAIIPSVSCHLGKASFLLGRDCPAAHCSASSRC